MLMAEASLRTGSAPIWKGCFGDQLDWLRLLICQAEPPLAYRLQQCKYYLGIQNPDVGTNAGLSARLGEPGAAQGRTGGFRVDYLDISPFQL